ncbi:hypothetical protein [Pontibacter pamirensis]|uniref:hypothetical protein n=1 Tax=Pontibacter pamirensis TaxID=2562824 RepID=UPI00138A4DBF|nr:hypothetical protein [Pontibacter pamirensis]
MHQTKERLGGVGQYPELRSERGKAMFGLRGLRAWAPEGTIEQTVHQQEKRQGLVRRSGGTRRHRPLQPSYRITRHFTRKLLNGVTGRKAGSGCQELFRLEKAAGTQQGNPQQQAT